MEKVNQSLNLLKLIKSKYVTVLKTIPLTDKIGDRLFNVLAMNNVLSQGRVTKLFARVRLSKLFLTFILKYQSHHGAEATVKWLKANLVAIQKELGQDRVVSTVPLGTILAFSRMTGGLPRIIPSENRARIRRGDPKEIRFWTGLFNIYRILKIPGKLKLETITNPFSGDTDILNTYIELAQSFNPFNKVDGYFEIVAKSLTPTKFYLSRAASPSNKVSANGVLTDLYLLDKCQPHLLQELMYYLYSVHPHVTPFLEQLQIGIKLIHGLISFDGKEIHGYDGKTYIQHSHLMLKESLRAYGEPDPFKGGGLSQFAAKEEAAGKIRLFALIDSISQSVLSPLHDMLFDLLKRIPNDGTFDQEASIRRSQQKATQANCAFSFDLTAATDRLPAKVTAKILATITGKDISESWLNIMTDRNFYFNSDLASKLGVSAGPYRYAVGQPMGGLSSWAGLAVTHHWIVQLASFNVTRDLRWNTSYEILGDDLVIFDPALAEEYLKIMSDLGCEINLHKSIVSYNRPVFEFAKRTCWGDKIVSGISFAQVRASHSVASRVANAISFAEAGLMSSVSLLAVTLSKYVFRHGHSSAERIFNNKNSIQTSRLIGLALLSLFGTLHHQGVVTLKELMTAIVDPRDEEFDYTGESVGIPVVASLKAIADILGNTKSDVPTVRKPLVFSHPVEREEIFKEYETEFPTIVLQFALDKAKKLWENQDKYVAAYAQSLYFGVYDESENHLDHVSYENLPSEYKLLLIQVNNFAENLLGLQDAKWHPETLYDHIYDLAYKHAKSGDRLVSFEAASDLLDRVEAMEFKLNSPEHIAPGKFVLESAPILNVIKGVDFKYMLNKQSYIKDFNFSEDHLSVLNR